MIITILLQYAYLSNTLTIEEDAANINDLDKAIEFLTNNIGRDSIFRINFKNSKKEYVLNLKYFSMFKITRKEIAEEQSQ